MFYEILKFLYYFYINNKEYCDSFCILLYLYLNNDKHFLILKELNE